MCDEKSIFESVASYYDQVAKKWITGIFHLSGKLILFLSNEQQILKIPLNSISGLEKRQSSLIYPAIVVSVSVNKYWFASFPNRDSLFNLVELFWREVLLSKDHKSSPVEPKPGTSSLGKELLGILHESEATLVNAANALSDQGKQIEESQNTVDDINSDLNVAERFIKNMSSFNSILQISKVNKIEKQQETLKCFKVSYTFSEAIADNSFWDKGILLFSDEKISLVNDSKTNQFSINHSNIISCEVISSWKLQLIYTTNNQSKSCHIVCPRLSKFLKCLNSSSIRDKLVYISDKPSTSLEYSSGPSTSGSLSSLLSPKNEENVSQKFDAEQLQENCKLISDADIEEISNKLNDLQTLASELTIEQQNQMEKINALMSNAESTEIRLKADTKKIKKLI